jgi:DNA primase
MKTDRALEEIKSRTDIVEFISDYVALKKSGQNYKGLCPFHSEKTPSFMVSQSKQIFHCFGCGVGGDVVAFLMKQENLSFGEALRYLAKKTGIVLSDHQSGRYVSDKRDSILKINEEALHYFKNNLQASGPARDYLKKRDISDESIDRFHIGYATGQRDGLLTHLKKKGHVDSVLIKTGLFAEDSSGLRDMFRRRIIFPIFNVKNDAIAFGGRVMDDALPKYINSPETDVFKKSETLFAINLAKEDIRKKGDAIIVEGYLDALVCHQFGFANTVAPLGTALTSRQLQKIKLLARNVVLVFDSDEAGISAARRSLAVICDTGFTAKVLLLPGGEDPDSFLRKSGPAPFKKLLADAVSSVEFLYKTAKGDRTERVREVLAVIVSAKDLILADAMLGELADRSRINESVLRNELDKMRSKSSQRASGSSGKAREFSNREEYLLLSAVIAFPERAEAVLSRISINDLKENTVRSIFNKIKACKDAPTVDLILACADEAERSLITELSIRPGFDPEHIGQNIDDCLMTMRKKGFEERNRLAEISGDVLLLDSLLKEKRKLMKG